MVHPLPVGNALRLFLQPPASAVQWRVLRKGQDAFSGVDDPTAAVIYEGDENVIVDTASLPNGLMQFYRPFYTANGTTWTPGPTASGTAFATYEEISTDVLPFLRDRLEAGLKVEVERGNLQNPLGYIQVTNGTPLLERDHAFPMVSIHLDAEDPTIRAIGDDLLGDTFDGIGGDWSESEGWISNVRVSVIGWSLNADERIVLRQALRRVVIANLPVFADQGWQQVALGLQDVDAVSGEYSAPIFQVMGSFTCLAPTIVAGSVGAVREVISEVVSAEDSAAP